MCGFFYLLYFLSYSVTKNHYQDKDANISFLNEPQFE